jgi:hypothetical protein
MVADYVCPLALRHLTKCILRGVSTPDVPLPSRKLFNCFSVEIRSLLGYYAVYSGNSLLTFRKKPIGPIFKGLLEIPYP